MARRSLAFALLPLVIALGSAACGASDDDGSTAESRSAHEKADGPTRKQFVAQAKAICTAPGDELPRGLREAPPEEQLTIAMKVWSDVVRELRELEPPAGEEARVDQMLTHFETAIRIGRRASAVDDEMALAVFAGLFDQASRGAAIAESYGLGVCSPVPALPPAEELSENEAYRDAMLDLIREVEKNEPPLVIQP